MRPRKNYSGIKGYFKVVLAHKFLVGGVALGSLVLAISSSFLLPKVYRASTMLELGGVNYGATFLSVERSAQLVTKISQGSYDSRIANELNISTTDLPRVRAANLADATGSELKPLIRLTADSSNPDLADRVIQVLTQAIVSDHEAGLAARRETTNEGIAELEGRIEALEGEKKSLTAEIQLLRSYLISNQSLVVRLALESAIRQLEDTRGDIEDLYTRIGSLKSSLADIQSTQVVGETSAREDLVSPNLGMNLVVALTLGTFLGLAAALAKNSWARV